jgi:hypothetical protein
VAHPIGDASLSLRTTGVARSNATFVVPLCASLVIMGVARHCERASPAQRAPNASSRFRLLLPSFIAR